MGFLFPVWLTKLVMREESDMSKSRKAAQTGSKPLRGWKLGEAKARFSDVVRLAASGQPQRVSVRGKDAVVVVAASEFERLCARGESASLHDLLSQSPLNRLDFGVEGVKSPVREVDL
jgi:antitoxin Phd